MPPDPVAVAVAQQEARKVADRVADALEKRVSDRMATVPLEIAEHFAAGAPPGPRGLKGEKGPKGDRGERGERGTKGDKGAIGPTGLGEVLVPRGLWNKDTLYQRLDVVTVEGSSYVAIGPSRGQKPPDRSWQLIAARGSQGIPGRPGGMSSGGGGGAGGSALTVSDEGTPLDTAVTSIDFTGAGVTASVVGHAVTVDIPAGAGPLTTVVYDLTTPELALLGSAIEVVPAPGPNKVIVPVSATFQYHAGTAGFAEPQPLFLVDDDGGAFLLTNTVNFELLEDRLAVFSVDAFGLYSSALGDSVDKPLSLKAATNPDYAGSILTSSVFVAGTGYAPGDTGTIATFVATGTDAVYEIDTVDGGGEVLTFHLTDNGTGFELGEPTTIVLTGAGDGAFQPQVDSIVELSDGTGRLVLLYYVMDTLP